jgi:hypothetical protein
VDHRDHTGWRDRPVRILVSAVTVEGTGVMLALAVMVAVVIISRVWFDRRR